MKEIIFLSVLAATGCLAANDTLRFFILGDFGGSGHSPYSSTTEVHVANRIAQIATSKGGVDFIMELGDNFYEYGIKNLEDHRFRDTFEKVFHHNVLQVPWYFIAGNHDHRGNVSAQILYSKKSQRWNFPYYYYPLSFKIPGGDASIDFVMLDTVTLCGHASDEEFGEQPEGPWDVADADAQWAFLTNRLTLSKATYLWTMGHYPVYSIGGHGPTHCLTHGLLPLLEKYNANGHMCGHDHNLQHIRTSHSGNTLDFFVSGASAKTSTTVSHRSSVPGGSSRFHWANTHAHGGFLYAEATAHQITFTFYDSNGHVLYTTISHPRKKGSSVVG